MENEGLERNAKQLLDSMKGGHYGTPRISSEYPDCSLPMTGDLNNCCAFACKYCFADFSKSNNPSMEGNFSFKTVDVNYVRKLFNGEYSDESFYKFFIKNRFPWHWGGLSDSFDQTELSTGIAYEVLKILIEKNYPTVISTKGTIMAEVPKYYELLKSASKNKNFVFQFSIITNSDEKSEQIEKYVPSTTKRLEAMKKMSDLGFWTVLRLRPFIIGLSDIELEGLLTRARNAGARAISTEFFCFDQRCGKDTIQNKYKFMSDLLGFNIEEYYSALSPSERGTYQRLNRDVKEQYVKRMWIKCHEIGLQFNISDPDFKELNESSSCCGIPNTRKEYDSDCVNFSRGQMTHHLVELRKRYYKSGGKDKYLTINQVFADIPNKWNEDPTLYYTCSLKRWGTQYGQLYKTYKDDFIDIWNKLRSPSNIRNYFHGILKPAYVDKNKNIVYEYCPQEYEARWAKEKLL